MEKARKSVNPWLVIALALLALAAGSQQASAARRALLIGIDRYSPEPGAPAARRGLVPSSSEWTDLRGPVNDVEALRGLLISRYGFPSASVRVLTDGAATRAEILRSLREHLVEPSQPGDVHVFYFAGHGSQVHNAASPELDLLDETIVPADASRGAPDIRDKELRRVFNDVLDRGAELVALFDSCNSGSAMRSLERLPGVRFLPPSVTTPAVSGPQPVDPRPAPEERGALLFAAAQDDQLAREARDENGYVRGAFSHALVTALRQAPVDEPAERVFQRLSVHMQHSARGQHPVLAGPPGRRARPLFGGTAAQTPGRPLAPALGPAKGWRVLLGAGPAAGFHPHSELVATRANAGPLRLRVESAEGLNRVTARVIAGDPASIRTADLFQLDRWVAPAGGALRLFLPHSLPTDLRQQLARHIAASPGTLELSEEPGAHYALEGSGQTGFGWTRRDALSAAAIGLPERTARIPASAENAVRELLDLALRLAEIRAWLVLEAPPDEGRFPYHLVLRNPETGALIPGGVVMGGDHYELMLQRSAAAEARSIERRYVYVFVLDSHGRRRLLFPSPERGNVENRLPLQMRGAGEAPALMPLGRTSIVVEPPFGTDTLVLLTSVEPISDPAVLEGRPVRTRAANPLDDLLAAVGSLTGSAPATPLGWSIERVALHSMLRR